MTQHGFGLARTAYEAYAVALKYKTFRGEDMLKFDELPDNIKLGWQAAAHAASAATVKVIVDSDAIISAIDEETSKANHSKLIDLSDNPVPQIKRTQQF